MTAFDRRAELQDISDQPMTVAEQLDNAKTGEEFGNVILSVFTQLDKMRNTE